MTGPGASPLRRVVRIPVPASSSGETLEADYHPPAGSSRPGDPGAPVVILAHGLGAERTFGLEPVARALQHRGYGVLVPDYRGFGGSDGEPRLLVDAARHREDVAAALDFAAELPGVDPERRVLWGVSFGGGHVLHVAARRPEVAAVIALVPHVDGLAAALRFPLRLLPAALLAGVLDLLQEARGATPRRIPLIAPEGFAALPGLETYRRYTSILPPGLPDPTGENWDGRVPARFLLKVMLDRPGSEAGGIHCPVLVQAATDDEIIPFSAVRRMADRLRDGRLEAHPMGHFGPYAEPWATRLVDSQLAFLDDVVGGPLR